MEYRVWLLSAILWSVLSTKFLAADTPGLVQVLQPGFEVVELPLKLPNLNNLRYRPDGKLYALGYNGNVWLLRDGDGDHLEDSSQIFFENQSALRGPIGLAVIPNGHELLKREGKLVSSAQGLVVASKGKVSALIDFDGDDIAEVERVIASGWQEIKPNVDTIGVAIHPVDGAIYFGIGTAAYNNAYLLDPQGKSGFDISSVRGTIQRIKPDLTDRETVCTGVRFTIGMEFNEHNELFATEQEGATWLANGNPFDELLHIRPGRHYGFPPRHPRHLPSVFDEPSLYDFRPQHQSTCGLVFNLPRPPFTKTFGPPEWLGNLFVTGESRGKLYRTKLVRTENGDYVAESEIFASLGMLTVDCTLTPPGNLLVCCHSGGPDWGTGPNGDGKLFLIRPRDAHHPRAIATWASGPNEVRVAFDRTLDPDELKGLTSKIAITAGPYVGAGDRFEVIRPGYEVVKRQLAVAAQHLEVYSTGLAADQRTLVLSTGPQNANAQYAVRLPALVHENDPTPENAIVQERSIDVAYSLTGVQVEWAEDKSTAQPASPAAIWRGVIPHLDLDVSRALRANVSEMQSLWERLSRRGTLKLATQIDTSGLFLPETQLGSQLDFSEEEDQWITQRQLRMRFPAPFAIRSGDTTLASVAKPEGHEVVLDLPLSATTLVPLEISLPTGAANFEFRVQWHAIFANANQRSGALPLHRMLLPWAKRTPTLERSNSERRIPELADANWGRGRHVFHSGQTACGRCHAVHGEGGAIGPDLSNLVHRDFESVVRDIRYPSFAINPDFVTYAVLTKSGQVLTGTVQNESDKLKVGDMEGKTSFVHRDEVESLRAQTKSVMPEGIVEKLTDQQWRDLLAYIMLPPPRMPMDAKETPPRLRTASELKAVLKNSSTDVPNLRPLRLLLIGGKKDHGPGEHDYPAWLRTWSQILSAADGVQVAIANDWPTQPQLDEADTAIIFQKGDWTEQRAIQLDRHLAKGRGLVLIHWAIEGGKGAEFFAERIGLASNRAQTQFRHGPLEIDWSAGQEHPIVRNFKSLSLHDESYWNLVGRAEGIQPLAYGGVEAGTVRPPLFWTVERGNGRVFVSIPGHYSWTFDDPLFRVILFRSIAWTCRENVDRFNSIVPLGVTFAPEKEREKGNK